MSRPSRTPSSYCRTHVGRLPSIQHRRTTIGDLRPLMRVDLSKSGGITRQIKRFFRDVSPRLLPWEESVRVIEGHHGSGVASYFLFLRWSVCFNSLFFCLLLGFIVIPQVVFDKKDYTKAVLGTNRSRVHTNYSQYCSQLYIVNQSTSLQGRFLEFLKGTGWMEKTPMFYGYYEGKELDRRITYALPTAYILACITCLVYTVIMLAKKSASNFRDIVYDATPSNRFQFTTLVFLGWDHTMSDATSATLTRRSLKKQIISELAEKEYRIKRRGMTTLQNVRIILIRLLVNIFVLLCLVLSAALIYFATQYTTMYVKLDEFRTLHESVRFLIQYLPSITISALNSIIPILFSMISSVEDYLPQNEVVITLVRTILIRLASLIFMVASLYKEVTCATKDDCNVGMAGCTPFRCWETYIGQQFHKLVIMDFLITLCMCTTIEPLRKLISKCTEIKFIEPKFDVRLNVLDLVYTQSLCWLGFFFAPLLPSMVFLKLVFTFYFKRLSALHWCAPFKKPYKASKSESLFATVLMMSFFLCCLPIMYMIRFVPPSRGCGPFRVYNNIYDILIITIELWPLTATVLFRFVTTSTFLLAVIIIMTLCLYHCAKRGSAQNETIELLTNQLNMERKENTYFLVDANRKRKKPGYDNPAPSVTTIYIDSEDRVLPAVTK